MKDMRDTKKKKDKKDKSAREDKVKEGGSSQEGESELDSMASYSADEFDLPDGGKAILSRLMRNALHTMALISFVGILEEEQATIQGKRDQRVRLCILFQGC
ncbi:hypothetical protein BGZ72_004639 [Mortierella alpina]|nr:hypothetical protein BGZ72_004639 [Mortierella alpina]